MIENYKFDLKLIDRLLLEVINKYPTMNTKLLLEYLVLDPLIWLYSPLDSLNKLEVVIKDFNVTRILDFLLNFLETFIVKDPNVYNKHIDKIWNLCMNYAFKDIKSLKCLVNYINIYHIKKLPNYPILLLNVLKMILSLYLSNNQAVHNEIYNEIKVKKDSKVLTTILSIILYFVRYLEEDKENAVVDKILGICLYIFLNFDWNSARVTSKVPQKRKSSNLSVEKGKANLIQFLITTENIKDAELHALDTIFSQNTQFKLGPISFKALMAIIMEHPEILADEFSFKAVTSERQVYKSSKILLFVLELALQRLNRNQATELINIIKSKIGTLKDTMTTEDTKLIFKLSEIIESKELMHIQIDLLYSKLSFTSPHLFNSIGGNYNYKLNTLNVMLKSLQGIMKKNDIRTSIECIEFAYALEDIFAGNFYNADNKEPFVNTLVRLILCMSKVELLYVSVPIWNVIETREVQDINEHQEREGGILRILLKLIFMCMREKLNMGYILLKFIVFREEKDKNTMKRYLGITRTITNKGAKKFTLLKLMQNDPIANERLRILNDFIMKKIIGDRCSIMTNQKTKTEDINFFSHDHTLTMYLFTSLIQLVYFELFKTNTHVNFPKDDNVLEEELKSYKKHKRISLECMNLLEIIKELVTSNESTLQDSINEFKKYIGTKKTMTELRATYFIQPNIHNVYSVLNNTQEEYKSIEEPKAKISWKMLVGDFIKDWKIFLVAFINFIKSKSTIDYINERLITLLLTPLNLYRVYPMLLLINTHPFHKLDTYIIKNVGAGLKSKKSVDKDLLDLMWKQYTSIKLSRVKLERDLFSSSKYKKYNKVTYEMFSELGCYFNEDHYNSHKQLFEYISRHYVKLMKQSENIRTTKEFVKLSSLKDGLSRPMILKKVREINLSNRYEYLRHFILKKMLIKYLANKSMPECWYMIDFKFKQIEDLFSKSNTNVRKSVEECVPKGNKDYKCELITINRVIFGRLLLNSKHLIFFNTKRSPTKQYKGGAELEDQLNDKEVRKKFELEEIEEIIVRRYNLIQQAIEIYFTNSKPLFFSLLKKKRLHKFLNDIQGILKKNQVIDKPEKHFLESNYTELWSKGNISNFHYLMLLNKYGGRSFNDLNQYPIFPLIIKNDYNISQTKADAIHYPIVVYQYMKSLEPYLSLATKFNKYYKSIEDGYEVVPEYYYLYEIFTNNNLSNNFIPIPHWVKNKYHLADCNVKELESIKTSITLHKWIDLTFGINQSNIKTEDANHIKIFAFDHPQKKEAKLMKETKGLIFNPYMNINEPLINTIYALEEKNAVVYIGALKESVLVITSSYNLYKSNLLPKPKTFIKSNILSSFKHFYDSEKNAYKCDAQRCVAAVPDSNYVITCRHYDNSCKLLNHSQGIIESTINFHKSMVNCVYVSKSKKLFTGSCDGILAMWELDKKNLNYPKWHALNHYSTIISLDADEKLGVVVTAAKDNTITIRRLNTGKLIRVIRPIEEVFVISQVRISPKEYIIVATTYRNAGCIFVYTVNGELIVKKLIDDVIVEIIVNGGEFIAVGANGLVKKYDIVSLSEFSLFDKTELEKQNIHLSAASIISNKEYQYLALGTTIGTLYCLSVNPKS